MNTQQFNDLALNEPKYQVIRSSTSLGSVDSTISQLPLQSQTLLQPVIKQSTQLIQSPLQSLQPIAKQSIQSIHQQSSLQSQTFLQPVIKQSTQPIQSIPQQIIDNQRSLPDLIRIGDILKAQVPVNQNNQLPIQLIDISKNTSIDILIEFLAYEWSRYWKITVNLNEYKVLKTEFKAYNKWIKMLMNGLAPDSSYLSVEDKYELLFAKNDDYKEIEDNWRPNGRWAYATMGRFYLINLSFDDDDEINGENDIDLDKIKLEHSDLLVQILTDKFDSNNEASLGYSILLLTQILIDEKRFI